jgi:lysyl-tRNA synthetase class 2
MTQLSLEALIKRSNLKQCLRDYLKAEGLIEIDVPCLAKNACPDSAVAPIGFSIQQEKCFLQPSPEILLKRLLAKHSIDCYSLGPVFRDDPVSPMHNLEFLMLEFYLMGRRYNELKEKTLKICTLFLGERPIEVFSYQDVWGFVTTTPYCFEKKYFTDLLEVNKIDYQEEWDVRALEDLAFSVLCQPHLGQKTFTLIDGFPPEQAALARLEGNEAQRFELFIDGLELANGYDELIAPEQNRERFEQWHQQRERANLPNWSLDQKFMDVLTSLPECSGVALGLERLLMLALNKNSLEQSMVFSWNQL